MLKAIVAQKATFAFISPMRANQKAEPETVVGIESMLVHCQLALLMTLKKAIKKPAKAMKGTLQLTICKTLCPVLGGE
jgi:hypothetical protein